MERTVTIFFMFLSVLGNAQSLAKIAYSRDYEFKEGVFLTINHFKNNDPIPKSSIVSPLPKTDVDFLTQILEHTFFTCLDSLGSEKKIQTNMVWGYSQNRNIYIYFNNEFSRINVIGTLCLFSSMVSRTPLRSEPISDLYAIEPVFNELQQFVFDMQTLKVYEFNSQNMELLLKNDDELYAQFMKLKKREKADSIFIYLRKYNEKHPLYLPSN